MCTESTEWASKSILKSPIVGNNSKKGHFFLTKNRPRSRNPKTGSAKYLASVDSWAIRYTMLSKGPYHALSRVATNYHAIRGPHKFSEGLTKVSEGATMLSKSPTILSEGSTCIRMLSRLCARMLWPSWSLVGPSERIVGSFES